MAIKKPLSLYGGDIKELQTGDELGVTLNLLSDVTAPTPTTGDVLTWNGTEWVNSVPSGGGGSVNYGLLNNSIIQTGGSF